MKTYILILVILISLSSYNQKSIESLLETENPLFIIKAPNIKRYLSTQKHFFILIHSPWCKWSQKFETILLKINRHLKLELQNGYLGIIDQTIENFTEHFKDEIDSGLLEPSYNYPNFIYYENGKRVEDYKNRLAFDDIFLWIKR